jgi:hypothetical protein
LVWRADLRQTWRLRIRSRRVEWFSCNPIVGTQSCIVSKRLGDVQLRVVNQLCCITRCRSFLFTFEWPHGV